MTLFLLWIGTYCISCVVQQTSGVKDLSSLVRYDDSSLAAMRHVQSIIPVVRPRPNTRSHSVLLHVLCLFPAQRRLRPSLAYHFFISLFYHVYCNGQQEPLQGNELLCSLFYWGLQWCPVFWVFLFNGRKQSAKLCFVCDSSKTVSNSFFLQLTVKAWSILCVFWGGQTVLGSAKLCTYLSHGPN